MDVVNLSVEEYIDAKLRYLMFGQASFLVDQFLDVEPQDKPVRIVESRKHSIEEHIDGIIQMSVDSMIDLDDSERGIFTFNRDKMMTIAKRIAKESEMAAFLAMSALMLHGYQIGPSTERLMRQYHRDNYMEVRSWLANALR